MSDPDSMLDELESLVKKNALSHADRVFMFDEINDLRKDLHFKRVSYEGLCYFYNNVKSCYK